VRFAGPLGGPSDGISQRILADLARENIDVRGAVRITKATAPLSSIMIDERGERTIATYRDPLLNAARAANPNRLLDGIALLLADNRFPEFVQPICTTAQSRGLPVILDADKPTSEDDPLFASASHVIFSSECLRATTGFSDLHGALRHMKSRLAAFLAVTDGANDVLWTQAGPPKRMPVIAVKAVDTLAAGDVFHGALALALTERMSEPAALRFAAAAASLKCSRFGGISGAPTRAELDGFLSTRVVEGGPEGG
jgi:sugar/nucleoside kinase (ribokinase family)